MDPRSGLAPSQLCAWRGARSAPLHDQLVRAADELQAVCLVEVRADIAAKQVARAARAQAPARDVLRVGPQQVAHGAVVRHLLLAVNGPDLRGAPSQWKPCPGLVCLLLSTCARARAALRPLPMARSRPAARRAPRPHNPCAHRLHWRSPRVSARGAAHHCKRAAAGTLESSTLCKPRARLVGTPASRACYALIPAGARLVEGADGGRQAAVHAEYPVVYKR